MTIIEKSAAAAIMLALLKSVDGFSTPRSTALGRPATTLASTVEEAVAVSTISSAKQDDESNSEPQVKSWDDDGFVFGLDGSGLERPKGKVAQIVVEGDSLTTTNTQRAVVWSTFLA